MKKLTPLLFLFLSACQTYENPTPTPDIEINGQIIGPDNKPITNVSIYFQPTTPGSQPTGFPLKQDGTFKGTIKAGTYHYCLTPANENDRKAQTILNKLPPTYTTLKPDRTITIKEGENHLKF